MKLPKTFGDWYLIFIYLFIIVMSMISCTKIGEYVQKPTCYRYLQLSDKYDDELRCIRTDTTFPNGRQSNVVCNDDTLTLQNYKGDTSGCIGGGYQSFRYIIIR